MTGNPKATPSMWGIDRRNPKFAPDAVIITLFGPGEAAIANANNPKARSQGSMAGPYAVKAADHVDRNRTFVNDYNVLVTLPRWTEGRAAKSSGEPNLHRS
ncbi:MAG: hypothetical protein O3B74_02380 [Proteobacteria bacterium]|nr:hypothetical protein [Pseudomonadota bacterium]